MAHKSVHAVGFLVHHLINSHLSYLAVVHVSQSIHKRASHGKRTQARQTDDPANEKRKPTAKKRSLTCYQHDTLDIIAVHI